MNRISILLFLFFTVSLTGQDTKKVGFFNYTYHEEKGTITLDIPESMLGEEFLYVSSLSAGVGSNDIGLDRGQLGDDRIVRFERHGAKVLMIQPNMDYRAESDNALERRAVTEAFAQSVLWGFELKESDEPNILKVDLTPFLMQDVHNVIGRLKSRNQGTYKLEKSRSVIWSERCKSFPDNSEFDAMLTFVGEPKGGWIRSVTPSPNAITVRQHHSFIRLPDNNYKKRDFHPYAGFNAISYADYATPIESPLQKKFIARHRLEKKNPAARVSEAKEPIIYYMDPGCPDPIKSALMEGARWWDQAFQAAGYAPGTFQVRELPEGADMMDVRYNVIQWVHRSTRGWSYGASVRDPRTGEILKGHVSLGSLRVRQDFLIAQGILSPYSSSDNANTVMKEMALARLRQLAAHEVGHTIGLSHNFAASAKDRASVMDYPHPYIQLTSSGEIDFSQAYDTKIGEWDKVSIIYGYSDFPEGTDESKALLDIIGKAQKDGFKFISDSDSRPTGGAHPVSHLWDNGEDIIGEMNRMMTLRKNALKRFGEASITTGTPLSELEKVLVPLYLMHRYQMEAVSKSIGGLHYEYYVKGDTYDHKVTPVSLQDQDNAIRTILNSLNASELALPNDIIELIPPPAFGYRRDRETFDSRTSLTFDALAPAESYCHTVFSLLLHPQRLSRIHRHNVAHGHPLKLDEYLVTIADAIFTQQSSDSYFNALEDLVKYTLISHLIKAAGGTSKDPLVASSARNCLSHIESAYLEDNTGLPAYLKFVIEKGLNDPTSVKVPELNDLPPGSPIGCGGR